MPSAPSRAATAVAARPATVLLALATALGLWFGLSAPDVSPVAVPVRVVETGVALDDDGPGRGGRR